MKRYLIGVISGMGMGVTPVLAHTGTGAIHTGFLAGLSHPLLGLDHLLAMVVVGVWAVTLKNDQRRWFVPVAFVLCMVLGAILGVSGIGAPVMEVAIAFSVLMLGLLLATRFRPPVMVAALLVGVFAIFHGNAHGVEMAQGIAVVGYFVGFVVATVTLHLAGMWLGTRMLVSERTIRAAGWLTGMMGLGLIVSA